MIATYRAVGLIFLGALRLFGLLDVALLPVLFGGELNKAPIRREQCLWRWPLASAELNDEVPKLNAPAGGATPTATTATAIGSIDLESNSIIQVYEACRMKKGVGLDGGLDDG